mgnify:CR=1 FL=1|jgi:hypothetical protein
MFRYLNVNPENRKEPDCVIRAISLATDIPYYFVAKLLEHNGDIYSCDDLCVTCYSNLLSGVFRLTRRNGMKKTIGQISEDFPNNTLLLRTDGHLSCSINGIVYDIWDCTNEVCDVFWIVD